jgi:hypothetical protein
MKKFELRYELEEARQNAYVTSYLIVKSLIESGNQIPEHVIEHFKSQDEHYQSARRRYEGTQDEVV